MHFTTYFTTQLWSISHSMDPKGRPEKLAIRDPDFWGPFLGCVGFLTDHSCIVKYAVKCINNTNSHLTRVRKFFHLGYVEDHKHPDPPAQPEKSHKITRKIPQKNQKNPTAMFTILQLNQKNPTKFSRPKKT